MQKNLNWPRYSWIWFQPSLKLYPSSSHKVTQSSQDKCSNPLAESHIRREKAET